MTHPTPGRIVVFVGKLPVGLKSTRKQKFANGVPIMKTTHLILTSRGLCAVTIDRVCDGEDERHGVIFCTLSGKKFFQQFNEFSFYIPATCKPAK